MHTKNSLKNIKRDDILFAKQPYNSKSEAVVALQERHLRPGELAAVRYYIIDSSINNWNKLAGVPTRMLMGCGGMDPKSGRDVFIFEDNGSSFEFTMPDNSIKELYGIDETIEFILQNLNASNSDTSNFVTHDELKQTINDIKIYVQEYFLSNIEENVKKEIENQNISQQVSDAVDEKLKDFDGVTTETLDEALQNNEYFAINVITPLTQLETTVKELVDASVNVDNIDGEEMEEWILE